MSLYPDYPIPSYSQITVSSITQSTQIFMVNFQEFTFPRSIGYSKECLGLHMGALHGADLGDGDGTKLQQVIARQHYFPIWGTCWQSLAGESHYICMSIDLSFLRRPPLQGLEAERHTCQQRCLVHRVRNLTKSYPAC